MNRILPAILATVGIALGILLFALLIPPLDVPQNNVRQRQVIPMFPPEVTAVPEGAVFTAPGNCAVSPDESQIALNGYAVFSLPAGEKLYDMPGNQPFYSPDGRYLSTVNSGVYESATGKQVIANDFVYQRFFSADSRLYIDDNAVYNLENGTTILTLQGINIMRDVLTGQIDFADFTPTGDIQVSTIVVNPITFSSSTREVVYDVDTMAVIIDTDNYDFPLLREEERTRRLLHFSPDGSRIAIFGVGLFSYPQMELIQPLPSYREEWQFVLFSPDSSLFMSVGYADETVSTKVAVEFIDVQTGQMVNRFTFPMPAFTSINDEFDISPNLDKIALPQRDANGVIQHWKVFDVRTEAVLTEIDGANPARDVYIFLYDVDENDQSPYYAAPKVIVDGRYAVDKQGIFDAETEKILLPLAGLEEISLTEGGSYAVTQRPCVVWNLP